MNRAALFLCATVAGVLFGPLAVLSLAGVPLGITIAGHGLRNL